MSRPIRTLYLPLLLSLSSLALSACAGPTARERELSRLDLFERHAGPPVASFHFWNIDRWEGLGPEHVAVWTRVNEAWLLRVDLPCSGLEFADGLAVTSTANRVHQRFDAVLFEHQRCRIREIRAVDGRALKAEQRATAAASGD